MGLAMWATASLFPSAPSFESVDPMVVLDDKGVRGRLSRSSFITLPSFGVKDSDVLYTSTHVDDYVPKTQIEEDEVESRCKDSEVGTQEEPVKSGKFGRGVGVPLLSEDQVFDALAKKNKAKNLKKNARIRRE